MAEPSTTGNETDDLNALVQCLTDRGCTFRNLVRDEKELKYVMIAGPDDVLIELSSGTSPPVGAFPV